MKDSQRKAIHAKKPFQKYFYKDLPPAIKKEYKKTYGVTSNWVILPNSMEIKLKKQRIKDMQSLKPLTPVGKRIQKNMIASHKREIKKKESK